MFDGQSFLAFASEKILSPSNGVPKKLLTGSTTGQRTRTKNAVAALLIGKPKLSNVLRVQRLPQPSVQSRPRRRRLPRPSHGLVWLRVAAPTQPLSPGRPHPQTTSLGASQQPCVSTESDTFRFRRSSIGLVCSGRTAQPPPYSLVHCKHPLKPSGRSNIRKSILSAFLRDHIHRAKRHPRPSCGLICGGSPG